MARVLLNAQFFLGCRQPKEALNDTWVLGYCFGFLDAMVQRAKLDQYSEGFALITIAFMALLPDNPKLGAEKVDRALDSQTDPRFMEGRRAGGGDFFNWLADGKIPPTSLALHLGSRGAPSQ
jgi:hypothetical protein